MKKLNITKKQFTESKYLQKKYGRLEYVSESGNVFKTDKGQLIKFVKESAEEDVDEHLKDIAFKYGFEESYANEYFINIDDNVMVTIEKHGTEVIIAKMWTKINDPIVRISVDYKDADAVCKFIKQLGFSVARAFDVFTNAKKELSRARRQGWAVNQSFPL